MRLGDCIHPIDVRNRDMISDKPMGINIDKYFMPSVANVVGTDLSNYKVVEKNQFACNLMHVGRDERLPVAILEQDAPIIVSPAYYVFEIKPDISLMPSFLMLWFKRPEFDRNAWFYTDADVRGGLDRDSFLDMSIPIPSIDEQRRIVAEYQAVDKRIISNEALITRLKEFAKFIFKKRIIDDISLDNLPIGWSLSTISGFCKKMTSGGTPNRGNDEYWINGTISWIKTDEVHDNIVFQAEEFITDEALKNSSAKLIPAGTVVMAMYGGGTIANIGFLQLDTTTNQACCNMICNNYSEAAYLFFHLLYHQEEIRRLANGGAQENLSQEVIGSTSIVKPDPDFDYSCFTSILDAIISYSKEIIIDRKIHELLLTRLSK